MFYVSGITGALIPFDPSLTPISNAASVEAISSQSNQVSLSQNIQPSASSTETSEAAIYEGAVTPTTQDMIGAGNALNVGRAGAAQAYHIHEPGYAEESKSFHETEPVVLVEKPTTINDQTKEHPNRVNPIRRKYQQGDAQKEPKKALIAEDIMSSPVFTLKENQLVEEALAVFKEHKFRHIPVLSLSGKLIGIISDRDFVGIHALKVSKHTQIKERMVTNILTARPEVSIKAVAEIMIIHRIGCIPIVNEESALVGILTRSDILRAIVHHAPIELWT